MLISRSVDTDHDLLADSDEVLYGTSVSNPDTDGDGMPDGFEVDYICLDPLADDAQLDADGDNISNIQEYLAGTDPCVGNDTDGDGMPDIWEAAHPCMNPALADAGLDYDSDSWTNLYEFQHGTDPCLAEDSDSDGMPDGYEQQHACLNYLVDDAGLNPDGDGFSNLTEFHMGTDPCAFTETARDLAVYDPAFLVPSCNSGISPCIVPASLIGGRDNVAGRPEPHQPNTISSSPCADGTTDVHIWDSMVFHSGGFINSITITDLNGPQFLPGDLVQVDANIFIYSWATLELYQAGDPLNPSWNFGGAIPQGNLMSGSTVMNVQMTIMLGSEPVQVIRAQLISDYFAPGPPAGACYNSSWQVEDHDDVMIRIGSPDSDGDGLSDADEINIYGTNPNNPDTDGDGLSDGQEVGIGTSPLLWDTDGDYIPDDYEVAHESGATPLDPLNALDGAMDFEAPGFKDGIPNYQEYWNGSDPWQKDPVPNPMFPDSPGCYYWAEGDGDGLSQSADRSVMQLKVLGLPADYSNVVPNNGDGQDLDGDGLVMFGDLTILRGFILNTSVGIVGTRAASLEQVYEPLSPVAVGGTAHVTVRVRNQGGVTNNYSAGFTVLFSIDPSSTGSAVLLGGDGSYGANTRFNVSGPAGSSDGGHATMHLKVTAPGTIIINAAVPACGVHGIGKWVDEVTLTPAFTIVTP